ncbi:hypothetical protein I7I50_00592 [Histoplasma capsulatum G186AR]|uniref:Uncharacterized protein n=1 Tax=Ajellomyces capsulatus TaxID=5037 RepID=A0A8H7YJM5_AJECA|nr:hypothetical protein I7I52_07860 [Histoplasma capsulatum]QSS72672.1 hypothetical protein I7I50_00592 [Histoplasma capsulatum G186AR]
MLESPKRHFEAGDEDHGSPIPSVIYPFCPLELMILPAITPLHDVRSLFLRLCSFGNLNRVKYVGLSSQDVGCTVQ